MQNVPDCRLRLRRCAGLLAYQRIAGGEFTASKSSRTVLAKRELGIRLLLMLSRKQGEQFDPFSTTDQKSTAGDFLDIVGHIFTGKAW